MLLLLTMAALPAVLSSSLMAGQSELVVHQKGTTIYHRPGCSVVRDGEGVVLLPRAQAEAKGYEPHAACDPGKAPAGAGKKADPAPAASETVYVAGPKYYHRKTCKHLGEKPRAVPLEAALKTHWPCPECKAPVLKRTNEPAVPGTNRRRGG
jgi:hypothetical protein